jgi:uncharacterized protein YuzE
MTVTIGNLTFDRTRYDVDDGDVLYLHRADPHSAIDFDVSPEGHALRFNSEGELIGITLINARWLLEEEGKIVLTLPERVEVDPDAIRDALTA